LRPLGGAPRLGWFAVATPGRYRAARTPAEAWANHTGASVPLVPGLGPPDALREARRWAARADSALHRGDLEGFARAFDALKRVLATP
ncbi:MAG TPA: hypothetical protein VG940_00110, partial [Gemmatimonadales bacterium]|nr:hypothetical protein [Gemmatimonadales bacterium]